MFGEGDMYDRETVLTGYSQNQKTLFPKKINEDNIIDVIIPEKGTFSYVMKGIAMVPDFIPGDILECQVVDKNAPLEYGRKYLIKMKNGPLVRKIMPNTTRKESITLISNDEIKFPAIPITLPEVEKLAVVISYLRSE